jgi:hypothetical protein
VFYTYDKFIGLEVATQIDNTVIAPPNFPNDLVGVETVAASDGMRADTNVVRLLDWHSGR